MFKVKNKLTEEIVQVLDTYCDDYGKTWFLIWIKNKWTWRSADLYVPPNYKVKYKWIVTGSRAFKNYPLLCKELDKIKEQINEVVCGDVNGVDMLARTYAYNNDIKIKSFPAEWERFNMAADSIRNDEMITYADKAIIFLDNEDIRSKDIIDKMKQLGKEIQIINI